MPNTQFLRGQLEAYSESWKRDHARAMACWELESRLKLALTLYDLIAEAAAKGDGDAASGTAARETSLRDFFALYRDWLDACEGPLRALASLELEGYQVGGGDRFREVYEEVRGLLQFSPDRIITSLRSMERGEGRPIGEVRDELRRQAGIKRGGGDPGAATGTR